MGITGETLQRIEKLKDQIKQLQKENRILGRENSRLNGELAQLADIEQIAEKEE